MPEHKGLVKWKWHCNKLFIFHLHDRVSNKQWVLLHRWAELFFVTTNLSTRLISYDMTHVEKDMKPSFDLFLPYDRIYCPETDWTIFITPLFDVTVVPLFTLWPS